MIMLCIYKSILNIIVGIVILQRNGTDLWIVGSGARRPGKEFNVMLFVLEILAQYRTNPARTPHVQSTSRVRVNRQC